MNIRAIVLDFDGVVLESVDVKTRGFRRLFESYPETVDRIVEFHLQNTGISRFEKFNVIYRDYLGLPLSDEEMETLGRRFAELVLEEVMACEFVPGAFMFLRKYSQDYPTFLASATPTDELRTIVVSRGLQGFFRGIHGYPPGKPAILRGLMAEFGWLPEEVLFVGDSVNDCAAAREAGVQFIGRVADGQQNPFPDNIDIVQDLAALDRLWPSLVSPCRVQANGRNSQQEGD